MVSEETGVIYGTNISTKIVINSLEKFILDFEVTKIHDGETTT